MSRFKKDSRSSTLRSQLSALRSPKGFTAIEVTMIVVVLAILAISIVVKNPFRTQDYATIAADQLIADIQYVQMRAMGIGNSQNITFTINSSGYNAAGEQKNLTGDVKVTSTTFGNVLTFNSLGEPTFGTTNKTISLSGGQTITVYAITGKVE
jgi:Tfp pilus assembly protein FimT